jgi:MFS family permease
MDSYRRVLRLPGMPVLLVAGFFARLPIGMVPLALLLSVKSATGSYAVAGTTVALHGVASAFSAPLLGRLTDQFGPRPVLRTTSIGYALGLLALLSAIACRSPVGLTFVVATLAGLPLPSVTSSLRSLWSRSIPDPILRQSAYTLDSISLEGVFISGPIVVGGIVALGSPLPALGVAAALCALGTVLIAESPSAARWIVVSAAPRNRGHGPLRISGMPTIMATLAALTFGFGMLDVAVPAFADAEGSAATAGPLLAVWGVGSAIGGLWFGARSVRMPLLNQLRWTVLAVAVGMAPLAAAQTVGIFALALFAAGLAIAPTFAVESSLVVAIAPPAMTTEALTWHTTVVFTASSLGAAVGGFMVERPAGVTWTLVAASASAVVAVVVVSWPLLSQRLKAAASRERFPPQT